MSIEPITRLQRFLRVLADSSADMPEPLRNLEKCCCYACGHLDTRPELHTTLEKLIASVRDKSIVPPKPNTRLEKYVAAMAGVWDDELPEPITREDKILFEAASGEDVTLSGNPLMLENCIGGKALKALHVYGKSTQDGTPSPDNPVPIVSAGDGGTITVTIGDGADEQKTITLPTPNGLPGIPVTSGGNYTDPSGQQWVCDEVDFARGVRVQRVGKMEITGTYTNNNIIISTSKWNSSVVDKVQPFRFRNIFSIPLSPVMCEILPSVKDKEPWGLAYECIGGVGRPKANVDFCISNERLGTTAETTSNEAINALKNWLKTNPISFRWALFDPIETPLTSAELAAYKALTTYAPTTVLQATDGAGMEVTYKCNVRKAEKTINDLYAELTAELEA